MKGLQFRRNLDPSQASETNHWVLHLAFSQTESIQIDPSPDLNGRMTLVVSRTGYLVSNNALKTVQLTTLANLKVGNVIEYLLTTGYDRYTFTTGGQGCRYWIYSTITQFRSEGYLVDDAKVTAATDALNTT
ncbi:MAG: hypothetical protein M1829_006569 [Trizodia sp. TS-e1964]|nr:MAG: hypothetical protein M1829_006569 [Trizodia sp. TS-e1964]